MAPHRVTLGDLADAAHAEPALRVRFTAPAGPIPLGFHLTEFKRNTVDSIDCGGVVNRWQEAAVELLGDTTGRAMVASTLSAILETTVNALPGIEALPLLIEYAPHDATVQRFEVALATVEGDELVVTLRDTHGECKANTRALSSGTACCAPGCCGQ
ncbi:MAG: DUF6428 family protein [Pseudomonadota bacterium]